MIFWIFASIVTFIATLCVVLPLARAEKDATPQIEYDKALYASRIEEIKRDQALGRISEKQAEDAIASEGRKLIALSKKLDNTTTKQNSSVNTNLHKALQVVSIVSIPALAFLVYIGLGSPHLPDQSLSSRLSADPQNLSFEEMIARAEAHLVKSPNDIRGWAVIAPAYTRLGQFDKAVNAWSRVRRLNPNFPDVSATLAEAMMDTTQGIVTKPVNALLVEEIKKNPASAKARYYLTLELSQKEQFSGAAKAWQDLIDGANPQAPWLETAREMRDSAMKSANLEIADLSEIKNPLDKYALASNQQPGPTQEQIRDAQNMSAQDRQAMIQSMVSGLSERLQEDPSDQTGWKRLIRAYGVLGDETKLLQAVESASKAHASDAAFVNEIKAMKNEILQ